MSLIPPRLVLSSLVPVLPPFDNQPLGEDVEGRCPPLTIISMIDHCSAQLLSLVGGARIGVDKQLDLQLESEELLCVRGYFLTWRLLLKYLEYANRQVSRNHDGRWVFLHLVSFILYF